MSDAANIRVFIKALKNTHILEARIYRTKNPHTLTDIITEVEKLYTVQQLTMTVIPSFMVNMVSNEEDQCFQCRELVHITGPLPLYQMS